MYNLFTKQFSLGFLILTVYAALLTGYVVGVAHQAVSYMASPIILHTMAKNQQQQQLEQQP